MGLKHLPSILRRWPRCVVLWVTLANQLGAIRLSVRNPRQLAMLLVALLVLTWFSISFDPSPPSLPASIYSLEGKALLTLFLCGAFALVSASRWRRISQSLPASWLASTVSLNGLSHLKRFITALWPLVMCGAGLAVLIGLVTPAGVIDPPPTLALVTFFAALVGTLVGLGIHPANRRHVKSRYVRKPAGQPGASANTSTTGLSLLPVLEAQAMSQPANARVLLLIALVTLPAGISGVMVILSLAGWALLAWLVTLAVALPVAATRANQWLQSTLLPFRTFWSLMLRRTLFHYIVAAALAGPLCLLLEATMLEVLRLIVFSLLLFFAWSSFCILSAWQGRDDRLLGGLGAAGATVLEHRFAGVGSLVAIVIATSCFHQGRRHART